MADLKTLYDKTETNQVDSTTFRNSVTGTTGTGSLVFNNGATLTGTPTSVTPTGGDESNKIATTAFVVNEITSLLSGFNLLTLSGTSHTLNVGAGKYFDGGTLVGDTTVTFSNIPAGASKWTYTFDTGWDVTDTSNVVYSEAPLDTSGQDTQPEGIFFKPDGTRMYLIGTTGDAIYQYDLSVPWVITTGVTFDASFSVAGQDTLPNGIFFKPDGTRMYVVGTSGGDVNQYNLSVPWDVTTGVTFDASFSVNSQEVLPEGIFFKPDGTRMYITGDAGADINQYDLSVPWDVTTGVTFDASFSVAGQDTEPNGIFFKPDGTRMYISGFDGDDVNQYNLTVPWDVTTGVTFDASFSAAGQTSFPIGLFFKPDGTRMYISGSGTGGEIYQYELFPYTISLPTTVRNFNYDMIKPGQNTIEFYTNNGGTDIYISKHYIS